MKELLDYMVKELVDSPDDVEITEEPEGEKTVIFRQPWSGSEKIFRSSKET